MEITPQINDALSQIGAVAGICQLFVPHTTAGILVNENADPDVCDDMLGWLRKAVPEAGDYLHAEGNSPAHIKATLVGHSATIPVARGRLALGTWQGVFLAEFDGPRERTVVVSVVG
jgi:secondary thiamine-phosphate synthase enzyme